MSHEPLDQQRISRILGSETEPLEGNGMGQYLRKSKAKGSIAGVWHALKQPCNDCWYLCGPKRMLRIGKKDSDREFAERLAGLLNGSELR